MSDEVTDTTQHAYRIRDWQETFETAESKRYSALTWISTPLKQDGKGRRRLVRRENGAALWGAWIAMAQVAATCPTRGVLADSDGPLDSDDLEIATDLPAALFDELFDLLTDPSHKINWLEQVDWPDEQQETGPPKAKQAHPGANRKPQGETGSPTKKHPTRTKTRTKQNETERNENEAKGADAAQAQPIAPEPPGNSLSLQEPATDSSLSLSQNAARPLSRTRALMLFMDEVEPLFGRRSGGRLPRDDPGAQADQTCARNVFDEVWPDDARDGPESRERFGRLMDVVKSAKRGNVRTPMAWLQDTCRRRGLLDATEAVA